MKHPIKSILSVAVLLFCGCRSANTPITETPDPAVSENPASAVPAETAVSESANTLKEEIYVSDSSLFEGVYRPAVTFVSDGSFTFNENLLSGMGDYHGRYTVDENGYTCIVDSISFSGFAGDDIKEFSFVRIDEATLVLQNDLCGSVKNDRFHKLGESTTSFGTIKPAQEFSDMTSDRRYLSNSSDFSEPYQPSLILHEDGTFELEENLYEGMGHYYGTYTISDIYLNLTVETCDFHGYAGDSVTEIHFESLSDDVIQLMDDLCGSKKFDYWYLDISQ